MKTYIALDIGGTNVKYGLVTQFGEVMHQGETPTEAMKGQEQLIGKLVRIIEHLRSFETEVLGIGVCTPGVVDTLRGVVLGAVDNIPEWENTNVKYELESRTNIKTHVLNDVNAAALGEAWMGAGKDVSTFFCITLGTGVGGALVIDSKLYEGVHFRAAEIGYMRMDAMHSDNYEYLAATSALVRNANRLLNSETEAEFDGEAIFEQIKAGDPPMMEVFDQWIDKVAHGIANVICVLDPGLVIIGGGVSEQKTFLTERIAEKVDQYLPEEFRGGTVITPAVCGNKAGILGAVSHFIRESNV